MASTSLQAAQDVRDESYEALEDIGDNWDKLCDFIKKEGFQVDDIDAVIGDREIQMVLSELDQLEARFGRHKDQYEDAQREADDLAMLQEAKTYLKNTKKNDSADDVIADYVVDILEGSDSLSTRIHDIATKTSKRVIEERERKWKKIAAHLDSVDYEGTLNEIKELKKVVNTQTSRLRRLEVADKAKKFSLEKLKAENLRLEGELTSRPAKFQVEGEGEDAEKDYKQIVEDDVKISQFPTRWSSLAAILQKQGKIDAAAFEAEKQQLQARMNLLTNTYDATRSELRKSRSLVNKLETQVQEFETQTTKQSGEIDVWKKKSKKLADAADELRKFDKTETTRLETKVDELEYDLEVKDMAIADLKRERKKLKDEAKSDKEKFQLNQLEAAKTAATSQKLDTDAKKWLNKYEVECLARNAADQACDELREEKAKLQGKHDALDEKLVKANSQIDRQKTRAQEAESQCSAFSTQIVHLERLVSDQREVLEARNNVISNTKTELADLGFSLNEERKSNAKLQEALKEKNRAIEEGRRDANDRLDKAAESANTRVREQMDKHTKFRATAEVTLAESERDLKELRKNFDTLSSRYKTMKGDLDKTTKNLQDTRLEKATADGELSKYKNDMVVLNTTLNNLRNQLSDSSATSQNLEKQIELTKQISIQHNTALTKVVTLERLKADWQKVTVEYAYGFDGKYDLTEVVLSLDTPWPTSDTEINEHSSRWCRGFEILIGGPTTAYALWLQSCRKPETLTSAHIMSLINSGITTREIGFLVEMIKNVFNSTDGDFSFESSFFLLRSIEFLRLVLHGNKHFQPIKVIFDSLQKRIPGTHILEALYSHLHDLIMNVASDRGRQLFNIAPDGLFLAHDVKAFSWGQYVCIATPEEIHFRSIADLRVDLNDDLEREVYIKNFPSVDLELKAKMPLNEETETNLSKWFPNAKWI